MKIIRSGSFVQILFCSSLALVPVVGGCGDASDSQMDRKDSENASQTSDMSYLPYSIRFDLRGNPVIVDEKGNPAKLEAVEPPFKATSVADIQTISVVTYTGSCIQVYNIGGKLYSFSLPDAYCKSL